MAKYKVGDICIGQNFIYSTHHNGMECTVVGDYQMRRFNSIIIPGTVQEQMAYKVQWEDGSTTVITSDVYLRLKRDDTDWANKKVQDLLLTIKNKDLVPA